MRGKPANTLPGGKRPLAIVAMLSASLLLMGVLGWQSFKLHQSNAATADSVLHEYGILVADEFTRRSMASIGYRGHYTLISRLGELQSAEQMLAAVSQDKKLGNAAILADGFFTYDSSDLGSANLVINTELRALLHKVFNGDDIDGPYSSARTESNDLQIIYAIRISDDASRRMFGFTVNTVGLTRHLKEAFDRSPLLPPALAGGRLRNDLLYIRVTDPLDRVVFKTGQQYDPRITVRKILGDDYQGILAGYSIEVSVDPNAAPSLVIGGLPKSRLPLLLFLMALVFVLMLSAIWLFRREHAVMRLRTDFVSQVSHELRTPLTQIRMFAETLLLGRARNDDERQRSLQIIDRESRRLSHLVDNILLFSNISDATRIDRHRQALSPIVREVCDTVDITENGANIVLAADESVCANIDADALRQVVLNLLDNALKYGPPEQNVLVSISGAEGNATISIADQGVGIPDLERERVWTAFYRLRREEESAISGTGIGLSVVRELVEAMQGRCWIDSPNGGTRVNVEFRTEADNG